MGFFSNLKKNWKLMRIMKRIGKPYTAASVAEMITSPTISDAKKAELELFDLVCTDRETKAILDSYGATRADLEEYYRRLSSMGLNRWIRESYVAAAAIALKPTLIYLLKANKSPLPDGWTDKSRWIKIVIDLVSYFESGSIGPVSSTLGAADVKNSTDKDEVISATRDTVDEDKDTDEAISEIKNFFNQVEDTDTDMDEVISAIKDMINKGEEIIQSHPPEVRQLYFKGLPHFLEGAAKNDMTQQLAQQGISHDDTLAVSRLIFCSAYLSTWFHLNRDKQWGDKTAYSCMTMVTLLGLEPEKVKSGYEGIEQFWRRTLS